ncbi:alpha/beta hydrolase [Alcaligenaceae bacterium CGII-47]|nr:alpha/beta hydrolase [Alcaligenaceae bacterium CGII-47]
MPKTARGLHYRVDDVRAPWCQAGAPVLFHHGIGTSLGIWSDWIPIVAARHPALRFDMRGFGRSVIPPRDHVWSLEEMTNDVWEVIDNAGYDAVHLVGESFGATVVIAAAITRPERVLSLRILNGTYKGKGLGELAYWVDQFAAGDSLAWGKRMMENRFAPDVAPSAALTWFEREQEYTLPHVAMGLGMVLAETDLSAGLKTLNAPLSIVLPDASPFVPVEHGREMVRLANRATLRIVAGVKHGLPFSHAHQEAQDLLVALSAFE